MGVHCWTSIVPFKLILRRLFPDVWSENAALLKRLLKSYSNPPILYYGFNISLLYQEFETSHRLDVYICASGGLRYFWQKGIRWQNHPNMWYGLDWYYQFLLPGQVLSRKSDPAEIYLKVVRHICKCSRYLDISSAYGFLHWKNTLNTYILELDT